MGPALYRNQGVRAVGLWSALDPVFIVLYRITGNSVIDFFTGTFLVALLTVVLGEFTISIAYRVNREHLKVLNSKMVSMHNRSLDALKSGNKEKYKSSNKEANDAFGRVFFNAIALSAACLWPIFFALGWMQTRFIGIGFPVPFTGWEANYVVVFLAAYIICRILFGHLRPRLPYFKQVQRELDEQNKEAGKLESFADL